MATGRRVVEPFCLRSSCERGASGAPYGANCVRLTLRAADILTNSTHGPRRLEHRSLCVVRHRRAVALHSDLTCLSAISLAPKVTLLSK